MLWVRIRLVALGNHHMLCVPGKRITEAKQITNSLKYGYPQLIPTCVVDMRPSHRMIQTLNWGLLYFWFFIFEAKNKVWSLLTEPHRHKSRDGRDTVTSITVWYLSGEVPVADTDVRGCSAERRFITFTESIKWWINVMSIIERRVVRDPELLYLDPRRNQCEELKVTEHRWLF